MLNEIPINDFIRLFQSAFLGKLIGGLVHNLNGPLQNLGLDMEMAKHFLKGKSSFDNETANEIHGRLKRMEEEYERIDQLIKSAALKAAPDGLYNNQLMNLNEYMKEELSFLQSNLYFKHNVHTEQVYQENPPLIRVLSIHSLMALSWFLQFIIEEIEREGIKGLALRTAFHDSKVKILLSIEEGVLSERCMNMLTQEEFTSDDLQDEFRAWEIMYILMVFKEEGVLLECNMQPLGLEIIITLPVQHEET